MSFSTPTSAVRAVAAARGISVTGGVAAFTALNLAIYAQTGSEWWLAATMFLTFGVVGLVAPLTGALGDRFDRQKVMIASDVVAGALFVLLVFADDPKVMIGLAFLSALAEVPLWTAAAAAIPNMVPKDRVSWANSLAQLGHNAGVMLGPVIGGLLFSLFNAKAVFFANAVSFGVSALLVANTKARFADIRSEEEVKEHRGLQAGFKFLFQDRVLRFMNLGWAIVLIGMAMMLTADIPLAESFDPDGTGMAYGLMIGAWGAGSVVGSLLGRKVTHASEGSVLLYGSLFFTWTLAMIALSPVLWPVVLCLLISGLSEGVVQVAEHTIIQRRTPDAVRSRVFAASEAILSTTFALGFILAGPVVAAVGPRMVYAIAGVGGGLAVLLFIPIRRQLRLELASAEGGDRPTGAGDGADSSALEVLEVATHQAVGSSNPS